MRKSAYEGGRGGGEVLSKSVFCPKVNLCATEAKQVGKHVHAPLSLIAPLSMFFFRSRGSDPFPSLNEKDAQDNNRNAPINVFEMYSEIWFRVLSELLKLPSF